MNDFNFNAEPPTSVSDLFNHKTYRVPEYQRPYEWTEDKCETLWNDLYDAFTTNKNNPYFLGIIIRVTGKEDWTSKDDPRYDETKKYDIIDGQQRLISLSLLFRALYQQWHHNELEENLYIVDEYNRKITRIFSTVLGDIEQEKLEKCLSADNDISNLYSNKSNSPYEDNLKLFCDKVKECLKNGDEIRQFFKYLNEKVNFIPITSTDREYVLTIFETINNRGQNLTDSDIFKANLYKLAQQNNNDKESQDESSVFIEQWNELNKSLKEKDDIKEDPITFLFRCYMHIRRGQKGDITDIVGLKQFFQTGIIKQARKTEKSTPIKEYKLNYVPEDTRLKAWQYVMDDLMRIQKAWNYLSTNELSEKSRSNEMTQLRNEFLCWKYVLEKFQNEAWKYPVMAFLFTRLKYNEQRQTEYLDKKDLKTCCVFMRDIARFLYAKGLESTISKNTILGEMFIAVKCATKSEKEEKYTPTITLNENFKNKIETHIPGKLRHGFCAILELMERKNNEKINDNERYIPFKEKTQIEHILPKTWKDENYDKWKDNSATEVMDTIGNLCLWEHDRNIKGSKFWFGTKKEGYSTSQYILAKNLCNINGDFGKEQYDERHKQCVERLVNFFGGDTK